MRLSFGLAVLNIRRYPLRTLGSAVCLLFFSFALFSAVLFTRSLSGAVSEILKTRSSGNVVIISKTDIGELERISECPFILEAVPLYWDEYAFGYIEIDGIGKFETQSFIMESPDPKTLIPNTYLEEFRVIGGGELLAAGRMPEDPEEMIVCESLLKRLRIKDYGEVLEKTVTVTQSEPEYMRPVSFNNGRIVGVYSERFMEINALSGYNDRNMYGEYSDVVFMLNSEAEYESRIAAYCSVDEIDRAYEYLRGIYGKKKVLKTTLTSAAIEKLSGLNSFVGNLMYLAAGAVALIYVLIQIIMMANYIKEKTLFVTAADAFGCGRAHIFGAFAAENAALLIPVSAFSGALAGAFVKMIFGLVSAYAGVTLDVTIDFGIVLLAVAVMLLFEIFTVLLGTLLFRRVSND